MAGKLSFNLNEEIDSTLAPIEKGDETSGPTIADSILSSLMGDDEAFSSASSRRIKSEKNNESLAKIIANPLLLFGG